MEELHFYNKTVLLYLIMIYRTFYLTFNNCISIIYVKYNLVGDEMGKLIRLDNPIEIEFTLDKKVYKSPNSNFMILRIFSDTMEIKPYLNPVYNNVSMKA